jgi:zinc transport system permease protein
VLGIATVWLEYLLLILVAMAVVVLIRVVGIILVLALLTAPPAIAGLFTKSLSARMVVAVFVGALVCLAGLMVSYTLNIPSGAAIVILSVSVYLISYFLKTMAVRGKLQPNQPKGD